MISQITGSLVIYVAWVSFLLFPFLIIGFAIYSMLLRDRKRILSPNPPQWFLKLPEASQQIHLREMKGDTPALFSAQWFAEYWHGKRSAFYAMWTWAIVLPLIYVVIAQFVVAAVYNLFGSKLVIAIYAIVLLIYLYLMPLIIYGCTNNSPPFWKYVLRVLLAVFMTFLLVSIFVVGAMMR